jgi:uncharacterized protein (TIGR02145 family)
MKKKQTIIYLLMSIVIPSSYTFGQIGIKTSNPHLSSDLDLGSPDKALLLNRVPNISSIQLPINGMVIYDLSEKCMKAYQAGQWTSCYDGQTGGNGTVTSIDCNSVLSPEATAGQTSYNGSFVVSYTGGNAGDYPAQTLVSVPEGFTANLTAGNFNNGNGIVTYSVTASIVPTGGNYNFNIVLGGKICSKTITVSQGGGGVLPPNFTLAQNRIQYIASIFDNNYLPYTIPTGPATTTRPVDADGTTDQLIDYQGSITEAGIQVQIPIAGASGTGTIGEWTNTISIPAFLTEDGKSRLLQLSWTPQAYTSASKFITATIKAIGGPLKAKKLDINAGLGNDYLGILMGTFQYPYNNAGSFSNYAVRDIPGIPDKMFGKTDNDPALGQRHNFIYVPVQGEDGKVWLNNNLGADYSNTSSIDFNPGAQATSHSDYRAYGSLFQWGRKPDGHELIAYTSEITGTAINPITTQTLSDNPNHTKLIISPTTPLNWAVSNILTRWQTEASPNNPCPIGFKVPSQTEYNTLFTSAGITNASIAASSNLKLPLGGYRLGTYSSGTQTENDTRNQPINMGTGNSFYWTSSSTNIDGTGYNDNGISINIILNKVANYNKYRVSANMVRCIKD